MSGASIYILHCADGSYYTGITRRSVEERVSEHAQGLVDGCYTASRLPVLLMFSEYYGRIDEAVAAERRMKGWSRAKKEAYIRGDFERLSALARRRSSKKSSPFETGPSDPPQGEDSDT
ncbi:MAG TPA: GIY-YIG nuclease family protein [Methylocella sp.]|jgi:putative endonuclease